MKNTFIIFCCFICFSASSQTLGGSSVYNFIKLPATPLLTAAGGGNVSYKANEVGLAMNNPSLLNADLNYQLSASFNNFLGGIKAYSLSGAYQYAKADATIGAHIYFVDYGSIPQTDAAGNINGTFHPVDYVVQLSAAKKYLSKWSYGLSVKFINSSYQIYKSSALAFDVGVLYNDSANKFSASVMAKNMGVQLKTYAGQNEDLPFDLQVGVTKKLADAPFGFSLTAQHLNLFNITYNDTTFNNANTLEGTTSLQRLFNHFVIATHIYAGNNLEATIGYNFLRRSELNAGTSGNGLTGFSAGLRVKLQKLQILYAIASYQKSILYNQLGITMQMDKLISIGK